jgi:hypothetical protein
LWAKNRTATAPHWAGIGTGTGTARSFLAPWLCTTAADVAARFGTGCTSTSSGAPSNYCVLYGLSTFFALQPFSWNFKRTDVFAGHV